ncbi:uncharacterized protein FIBRA_04249 [Fibroporia radiculosa]|uniref:Protein-S-isoprenylcysteine O-methyltransferase n=1 Tax=Fibroporia radiculosa TaxID=599839 RepID=J4IA25_9APHY|nr:uncharacterized protein FIBRA_04249 [Fibroporia radiculosa]CCM02171.1 predicted protein [Fibroporia radiculosa]
MSLAKIPFLLANTVSVYATLTPPNPQVPSGQRPKNIAMSERFFSAAARTASPIYKYIMCAGSLIESAVILARRWPSHPLSQRILGLFVNGSTTLASRITLSKAFFIGTALVTANALIRVLCYRALGRLFTYEVAIRDDHKLVTSGPYAYIRHPSYTTGLMCWVGMGVASISQGSWLKECGVLATPAGRAGVALYGAFFAYCTVLFVTRAPREDVLLRDQFESQWDEWAQRVPYRLIPYIY